MRVVAAILWGLLIAQGSQMIMVLAVLLVERPIDPLRTIFHAILQPASWDKLLIWAVGFAVAYHRFAATGTKRFLTASLKTCIPIAIIVIVVHYRFDVLQLANHLVQLPYIIFWTAYFVVWWALTGGGLWLLSRYEERIEA